MGVLTLGISAFDAQFRNQEDALHFAVFYTSAKTGPANNTVLPKRGIRVCLGEDTLNHKP